MNSGRGLDGLFLLADSSFTLMPLILLVKNLSAKKRCGVGRKRRDKIQSTVLYNAGIMLKNIPHLTVHKTNQAASQPRQKISFLQLSPLQFYTVVLVLKISG